ncbi:MAG: response regulator, partial [Candidatus Sumerlaeota bacterium]
AAERAARLCQQMLAYAGRHRPDAEHLHLGTLVEEMARLIEVSLPRNVVIDVKTNDTLPPIKADAEQLRHLIENLVNNASEAMEGEEGHIAIRTGMKIMSEKDCREAIVAQTDSQPGPYVYIEVEDNGCGMDEAVMERMFDPFFSTRFEGRGMGLSAVQGTVKAHGGLVETASQPGRGTRIRVLFPVANEKEQAEEESEVLASPFDVQLEGMVLVVDDEKTLLRVVRRMLERVGVAVLLASNGSDAVELMRRHKENIDAVVLDLTMPGMSGRETYDALRDLRPDVPILLISGYSENDARDEFAGCDICGFLQKPFNSEFFVSRITQLLGSIHQDKAKEKKE